MCCAVSEGPKHGSSSHSHKRTALATARAASSLPSSVSHWCFALSAPAMARRRAASARSATTLGGICCQVVRMAMRGALSVVLYLACDAAQPLCPALCGWQRRGALVKHPALGAGSLALLAAGQPCRHPLGLKQAVGAAVQVEGRGRDEARCSSPSLSLAATTHLGMLSFQRGVSSVTGLELASGVTELPIRIRKMLSQLCCLSSCCAAALSTLVGVIQAAL